MKGALEALDDATSKFEQLVGTEDRHELLDELERLKASDARRILLARVLSEQTRRRDRTSGVS